MRRPHLLVLIFFLGACASCALMLGDSYQQLRSVPDGMGVIYIFDDGAGVGSRVFIDPDLHTPSAKHYLVLATNGYYPYLTSEGAVRVFDDSESNPFGCVEIDVRSSQPQWVRVSERGDVLVVERVEPQTAERGLGEHRRLNRRALAKASGVATPRDCGQPVDDEANDLNEKKTEPNDANDHPKNKPDSESDDEPDEEPEDDLLDVKKPIELL